MKSETKTMSVVQLSYRMTEIGEQVRMLGWLLKRASGTIEEPLEDAGVTLERLGQELIDLESIPLIDHDGKPVK